MINRDTVGPIFSTKDVLQLVVLLLIAASYGGVAFWFGCWIINAKF
jgi:hypothetical protein